MLSLRFNEMCKQRQLHTRIWSLREGLEIYLDLGVICTETRVVNILNKQAPGTSYSPSIPFMSKEM